MKIEEKINYEAPLLNVEAASLEAGFALSGGFGGANQAGATVTESGDYTYNL